jgi:hypothetical protein
MLELQIKLLIALLSVANSATSPIEDDRDRGEVTATTAIIVLLVIAAIAAGTIIATRITTNANNVPTP